MTKKMTFKSPTTVSEDVLQKQCVAHLRTLDGLTNWHIADAVYELCFNGPGAGYKKRQAADSISGFPDMLIIHDASRSFCFIELKKPKGTMQPKQLKWQEKYPNSYRVVRTIEEFKEKMDLFLADIHKGEK